LSDNEDDITAQDCVNEQKKTAQQAEIPEANRNDATLFLFRDDPLPEKSHEEKSLAREADGQQPPLRRKFHILPDPAIRLRPILPARTGESVWSEA